jgi:hypothetical protein
VQGLLVLVGYHRLPSQRLPSRPFAKSLVTSGCSSFVVGYLRHPITPHLREHQMPVLWARPRNTHI